MPARQGLAHHAVAVLFEALDSSVRLSCFFSFFIAFILLENWQPMRNNMALKKQSRLAHYATNISVIMLDSLLVRLVFPMGLVIFSESIAAENIGLFNLLDFSGAFAIVLGIVLLDGIIYAQHRLFHRVDFFWRWHKVHHSDQDFDTSTALRFHPVEMLLSLLIKMAAIALLGISPLCIFVFEMLLSTMALFNHSNLALPAKFDHYLRYLLVTPNMHRIHHSTDGIEHNLNFGFNLSLWDRLFNSYRASPKQDYRLMPIGLSDYQGQPLTLAALLALPFITTKKDNNSHE